MTIFEFLKLKMTICEKKMTVFEFLKLKMTILSTVFAMRSWSLKESQKNHRHFRKLERRLWVKRSSAAAASASYTRECLKAVSSLSNVRSLKRIRKSKFNAKSKCFGNHFLLLLFSLLLFFYSTALYNGRLVILNTRTSVVITTVRRKQLMDKSISTFLWRSMIWTWSNWFSRKLI